MRSAIVQEALTWVGTPFHHRGRVKHVGVDCVGVVIETAKAVGIKVEDRSNYPKFPIHGVFVNAVDSQTEHVALKDVLPGDLMEFSWGGEPQHIAIVISINPVKIVHSFSIINACVVDEFDIVWQNRFVCARRFKELV
jgi:cell wall-associated NlpC family hydrolase